MNFYYFVRYLYLLLVEALDRLYRTCCADRSALSEVPAEANGEEEGETQVLILVVVIAGCIILLAILLVTRRCRGNTCLYLFLGGNLLFLF